MEIQYYNRSRGEMEVEQVYGDKFVEWLYGTKGGRKLSLLFCKAPLSMLYGMFQNLSWSKSKISPFIDEFKILSDDFLPEDGATPSDPYPNFNSFFVRRFKEGRREFVKEKVLMPAFSEARYFGFDKVDSNQTVPVKGQFLSSKLILKQDSWANVFEEGPMLIARLCPVDYHRFHFPDDGKVLENYRIGGVYHSVNPIALNQKNDVFAINERQVTILETQNFGKLAYVEVGAMMVGKIIQTSKQTSFKRGQEKGYFLFGGSTVIVMGEKGRWIPEQDILDYSSKGIETYLKLGESAAVAK